MEKDSNNKPDKEREVEAREDQSGDLQKEQKEKSKDNDPKEQPSIH